jgi:hypothetical protein
MYISNFSLAMEAEHGYKANFLLEVDIDGIE